MGWVSMQEDILRKLEDRFQELDSSLSDSELLRQCESLMRELRNGISAAQSLDGEMKQIDFSKKCEVLTDKNTQLEEETNILKKGLRESQDKELDLQRETRYLKSELRHVNEESRKLYKQVADLETIKRSQIGTINQLEQRIRTQEQQQRRLRSQEHKQESLAKSRLSQPIVTRFRNCPHCHRPVEGSSLGAHKQSCFQNPIVVAARKEKKNANGKPPKT